MIYYTKCVCVLQLSCFCGNDVTRIILLLCTGLDVSSSLSSCLAESYFDSDLVIALFYVQRRTDGHWITPHQDLPLTLHGEQLQVPMLLSHGA